jgi:hypothetical protein
VTFPRVATGLFVGFLVSCSPPTTRTVSIGEAYVGPTSLGLHQDLSAKSAIAATVQHGEKLEILEYRHRLVKVRTDHGVEAWTDMRQLLTPEQMADLRHMAERAGQYPSQGAATVFELLNVHTEPNRTSPSFWQVPENAKIDVIGHKLMPRNQAAQISAPPTTAKAVPQRRRAKERQSPARIGPPAPLPPPKPPDNWQALSVPRAQSLTPPQASPPEQKPPALVPMDDWSLVRAADSSKVGWVLTRMLSMAIPDEVAQYAEGHRITSYFALGQSKEGDAVKNDWLWTTITKGLEPYEFDSFRVFVWSHKHRRYETAYIERNVTGHFPVEVSNSNGVPSFSLILEDGSGQLLRKTYSFEGFRIRMVHKEPYAPRAQADAAKPAVSAVAEHPPQARSWFARLKDRLRHPFR